MLVFIAFFIQNSEIIVFWTTLLDGDSMKIKNLYIFLTLIIFTFSAYADNPGEVASEEVATQEEAVEQVVSEETSSTETDTAVENEDGAVVLEKVVVTGSKIKKSQVEGPLPLLVITKEDIDNSGFRNITEALQSIPSANQYTQNESLNNNFTPNANELDLRNLGPGRVLFLINGRRTADYPIPFNNAGNIVNTGVVPAGLVDRIEVLSQGASAIYGSDAVSGVVNIITVQGKDYSEFQLYSSQTEHGGDNITQATFTTGGFFGNSSWTLGINGEVRDPMYFADRDGFNSFTNDPGYGSAYVAPRAGLVWYTQAAAGGYNRYFGSEEFGIPCSSMSPDFFDFDKQDPEFNYRGSYPGRFCGHDYGSDRFGGTSATMSNEREDASAMFSFTHNFDNGITFDSRFYTYTDSAYYRSEVNRYLFMSGGILDPRRIGQFIATSNDPANQIDFADQTGYNQVSYFLRYFSANNAPNAEARTDVEEELMDGFMGLSGTTARGYEWSVGVNSTNYDYEADKQTFTDKMYDYFEERMCIAPASGKEHFHNAHPGGYVEHVLHITDLVVQIWDLWGKNGASIDDFDKEELIFAALHHDLGKVGGLAEDYYVPNESDWHRKNQGLIYRHNPNIQYMTVTDRAIWLLQHFDIKMSENEYLGLRLTDGMYDEGNIQYLKAYAPEKKLKTNMPHILHQADMATTRIEYEDWIRENTKEEIKVQGRVDNIKKAVTMEETSEQLSKKSKDLFEELFGDK